MDRDAIVAFWGPANMVRWTPDAITGTSLDVASSAFLLEVGMPAPRGGFQFLPGLSWETALPRSLDHIGRRVLAYQNSLPLFVEEQSGFVIMGAFVAHRGRGRRHPERLVNSSVEQFAASLTERERFSREYRYADDLDEAVIVLLEDRLRLIDETALTNDENWWSVDTNGLRFPE